MVPSTPGGLNRDPALRVLGRGLRGRCPRCGQGRLFERWHHLQERCTVCGLELATRDTWFFIYMSTGGLTGLLIVAMLLIQPPSILIGQLVLLPTALLLIAGTLPYRKGLAIAVDYLFSRSTEP